MKMAIGCRWAACSRRTALAETSRMQCFPWGRAGGAEADQQVAGKDTGARTGHSSWEGRERGIGRKGNDMDVERHADRES